jgi:amino acid permease
MAKNQDIDFKEIWISMFILGILIIVVVLLGVYVFSQISKTPFFQSCEKNSEPYNLTQCIILQRMIYSNMTPFSK